MTITDLKLATDTFWYELVDFAHSLWRDFTGLMLDLWHIWKMIVPSNPLGDPLGPALALVTLFCLMLWFLPKERY